MNLHYDHPILPLQHMIWQEWVLSRSNQTRPYDLWLPNRSRNWASHLGRLDAQVIARSVLFTTTVLEPSVIV
jgi:streptogramin lyase